MDKNTFKEYIIERTSEVPPAEVDSFLSSLPADYFETFSLLQVSKHIRELWALSNEKPFELEYNRVVADGTPGQIEIVVYAFDVPGFFAFFTGALSVSGYNILSGHIHTSSFTNGRRVLVDTFRGAIQYDFDRKLKSESDTIPDGIMVEKWFAQLKKTCTELFVEIGNISTGKVEGIRQAIIEKVARAAANLRGKRTVLFPVQIEMDTSSTDSTKIMVTSQDSPFFLYSLAGAMSLHNISIEHVEIETKDNLIKDTFFIVDAAGKPVRKADELNRIRFSILLTKQFTYSLDQAPDPYQALLRFDALIQDSAGGPASGALQRMLADPKSQQELARLLGASDFLWEDFIRLQHENLLPILSSSEKEEFVSSSQNELEQKLEKLLQRDLKDEYKDLNDTAFDKAKEAVNRFKDNEAYLIDIDHILRRDLDFFFLSRRLTKLAEVVIGKSAQLVWDRVVKKYGRPSGAAGLEAEWAVFGLGKLGGAALGYASDIELLFVYSDVGETTGPQFISNREFFEKFVREVSRFITARREGIFQVDLRLRPYGNDGPLAVHLESFIRYYSKGGDAHSAEKLALVRLRWIGGSRTFGEQVESIRDTMLYTSEAIDITQIRSLRQKQLNEKKGDNVKFSPGGLVDLEYNVQILQIIHGKSHPQLRNPGIHHTLNALSEIGTIDPLERESMIKAYRFLRNVINGLRMLRGNAQDLQFPAYGSLEFAHLARRMGYEVGEEQKLWVDFETCTAEIRSFIEHHLGREAIPGAITGNVADIVLSERISQEKCLAILSSGGFKNPQRGVVNIQSLAGMGLPKRDLAGLLVLAWEILKTVSDPDMALNNWEHFSRLHPNRPECMVKLFSQPRRMEILFTIFSGSQFLSRTLIRNPSFFDWITDPQIIGHIKNKKEMSRELAALRLNISMPADNQQADNQQADNQQADNQQADNQQADNQQADNQQADNLLSYNSRQEYPIKAGESSRAEWLNAIRKYRKREILRIGTRDICLNAGFEEVVAEISALAQAIVNETLQTLIQSCPPHEQALAEKFCVLAFGKLGGEELNYSSDIDLLGIYQPADQSPPKEKGLDKKNTHTPAPPHERPNQETTVNVSSSISSREAEELFYTKLMRELTRDLTDFTQEGQAYRVDLRLRPDGSSGSLVISLPGALTYYRTRASLWEFQALLKLRPLAGNIQVGEDFLRQLRPIISQTMLEYAPQVPRITGEMRHKSAEYLTNGEEQDIKNGPGGIRDIEFFLQGYQLMYGVTHPDILTPNTLAGLAALGETDLIDSAIALKLQEDYCFLRKVEHFLQIYDDQQRHALPKNRDFLKKMSDSVLGNKKALLGTKELLKKENYLQTAEPPGGRDSLPAFINVLTETQQRVRSLYSEFIDS